MKYFGEAIAYNHNGSYPYGYKLEVSKEELDIIYNALKLSGNDNLYKEIEMLHFIESAVKRYDKDDLEFDSGIDLDDESYYCL